MAGATSIVSKPAKLSLSKLLMTDSSYSTTNLFKSGTRPVLVSKQFSFTEGPAADNKGNIYFTDQPNNGIWKYDTNGKLMLFSNAAGRSNGMYFTKDNKLVTCADEDNQIWQFKADGTKDTVLLSSADGHKFNGPNDLWIDAKGGIYFTDPYYQRDYWTRTKPDLQGEKVYYLAKGQSKAVVVAETLQKPNGIAGTADGKYLYVADIKANKTYRFDITKEGALSNQQLFIDKGSDGLALDEQGNVYITGSKGITIFSNLGEKIGLIAIPESWTANLCFGGIKRNVLFITASKAVYTMQMNVHGSTKNASKQR
ncbi:SMP-30/gluconolactonase/LRE family protein [Mucilaginibacter sp. HME9299]|uniref:SMP-30/gluconolactonase/LRE family protein n=2 Tax=Mucilaginibacter aquatilis TaxID=1517760 RepID=A0A6I4IQL1_9SPHI|nr:SMP-30/gluconolactonase/LRE family protein [Mucilaginibacter aquatilis]